jgi:membrane-bound lytic murein transglycosylase D
MSRLTILFICLCCIFVHGCAHKSEPVVVHHDLGIEEEIFEPLDEELTESWPDVGDVELTEAERAALETVLEIPYPLHEYSARAIQQQFIFLVRKVPRTIRQWVERSGPYLDYIKEEFRAQGLPIELSYMPFIESGFNPLAYSRAGAAGIWQFMAGTGRRFGLRRDMWIDERRDPIKSTHAAVEYLKTLHELLGDWSLVITAYNAGEAKVMKAMEASGAKDFFELMQRNHTLDSRTRLRKETLDFVPRFLAVAKLINNLERLGFAEPNGGLAPKLVRIDVGPGVNLKALAKACGLSWDSFSKLNPAFRRNATPPDGEFKAMIPANKVAEAREFLSKPQPKLEYDDLGKYTVRQGDSWSLIARRTGFSVQLLKEANNTTSNLLRAGQVIFVPTRAETRKSKPPAKKAVDIPPGATTHVVKRGETLSHIADRTLVPVSELLAANNLSSPKALRAGQTIVIPRDKARKPAVASAPASTANPKATPVPSSTVEVAAGREVVRYRIESGDSLWVVARRFKVSTADLMRWNGLEKNAVLRPGDEIKVYR